MNTASQRVRVGCIKTSNKATTRRQSCYMAETMTAVAPTLESRHPSTAEIAGIWARHLLALYLPVNSLVFLWTGPHSWSVATLFMVPLVLAQQLDCSGRLLYERQPPEGLPAWPFDVLVYGLAALQVWVVVALVRLFTVQGLFSFDMLMIFLVVGSASGFSIVTAHELIHRRKPWEQWLGRLLLCTVLYEHFYTEHIRGHHLRVGTPEDPATARFGEAYEPFFRRTVPGQFRSAWRLELARLGAPEMGFFDRRMLRNRILHGLVLEWSLALAIFSAFGFVAFFAFVLQAFTAVRLLEAVNYFEHWGLRRRGRKVRPQDSWDTHAWFTYYGLIGLTRHADHHAMAARPYQLLRIHDEAPLLPAGTWGWSTWSWGGTRSSSVTPPRSWPAATSGPLRRWKKAAQQWPPIRTRRAPSSARPSGGARACRAADTSLDPSSQSRDTP